MAVQISSDAILPVEAAWITAKLNAHLRAFVADQSTIASQLEHDYGDEAHEIVQQFSDHGLDMFLPVVAGWFGVGTRWKNFSQWLLNEVQSGRVDKAQYSLQNFDSYRDILLAYGRHLGRVHSFRALSLTEEQYNTIVVNNTIWPTGRLKTDEQTVNSMVDKYGIKYICYARLYIGLGLVPYDPSLSLHDDGETAVCIASGYFSRDKKIYLMEMSVPKIELVGYKVVDVQDIAEKTSSGRWFKHNKIWFDAFDERTERYALYEIAHYRERCVSVRTFSNPSEVLEFLEPFAQSQLQKKIATESQQQHQQQC